MHKFVLELITEWRKLELPFAGATVITAVSGGADSLALLLALEELKIREKLELRLVAAHFNHKLRGRESDADEEFVKELATERSFELAVGHGPIAKEGNIEQNARDARYAFLAETAAALSAGHVLTAHTMNDQAETFLLNLIRGSGVKGLSGMRPMRPLSAGSRSALVRPLLRWARREDTENFCREKGIAFRYDTMNEDMSFKRVRVRKMLLPMLKEFNPKIVETLAQTAEMMTEHTRTSVREADQDSDEGGNDLPKQLSIQELNGLEPAQLHNILRTWLEQHRGNLRSIGLKHIQAVERLAFSTKSGRVAELPGFGRVRKTRGRLLFENIKVDK